MSEYLRSKRIIKAMEQPLHNRQKKRLQRQKENIKPSDSIIKNESVNKGVRIKIDGVNYINDYFDQIYCINLDRRSDRWLKIRTKFNKLGLNIKRISAIDGNLLSNDVLKKYRNRNNGEIGCMLTHYNIIEDAKKNNYKKILVLEDDVLFIEDFHNKFNEKIKNIPTDWKLLYLGATQHSVINEYHKDYYIPNGTDGTFAVAFDSSIYEEILLDKDIDFPIDGKLHRLQKKYSNNSFVLFPNLIIADVSDSDIRKSRNNIEFRRKMKWNIGYYDENYNNAIISLTTTKNKILDISKTIESLLKICPDFPIILNLNENEFNNKEQDLPIQLLDVLNKGLIEIIWGDKDYGLFNRIIYVKNKYPNIPIITADDNSVYTKDYATILYKNFLEYGFKKIIAIAEENNKNSSEMIFPTDFINTNFIELLSDNKIRKNYDYLLYKIYAFKLNIEFIHIENNSNYFKDKIDVNISNNLYEIEYFKYLWEKFIRNDIKVIISLTSWPKRINNVTTVINTILNNTILPNKIICNLSTEEFPNKEKDLPLELIELKRISNNIFDINWVGKNTGVFKKFIPTLTLYKGERFILFTIDDDELYKETYIETGLNGILDAYVVVIAKRSLTDVNAKGIWGGMSVYNSIVFKDDYIENLTQEIIDLKVNDPYTDKYLEVNGYKIKSICENHTQKYNDIHANRGKGYTQDFINNAKLVVNKHFKVDNRNMIFSMRLESSDFQRNGTILDINDTQMEKEFVNSCDKYCYKYKILRQDKSTMIDGYNLGQNKMLIFRDYLKRYRNEYDKVLLSDVFDVVILKPNLFEFMENDILYIGDETGTLDVNWVRQNSKALLKYDMFNQWYQSNKNKVMLNTGLIGGNIDLVIHLLDKICDIILKYCKNYDEGNDMFILNYICYSAINSGELKIIHGHPFNTKYKQYEHNNKECYLAHK